jgi:hypothetical protein
MPFNEFLNFIKEPDLNFENEYHDSIFKYSNTIVGKVLNMPNTLLTENRKIVILKDANLSVGLTNQEGMIFLVNEAYNLEITLRPAYFNLNSKKILFELSKSLSKKTRCYLQLSQMPSDLLIDLVEFEKLFGLALNIHSLSTNQRIISINNQENIYTSRRFWRTNGKEFVCRPNGGKLYITRLDVVEILGFQHPI